MVKKLVQMVPVLRAKIKTVTTCNLVRRKADTIDKIASFIYERIKKTNMYTRFVRARIKRRAPDNLT